MLAILMYVYSGLGRNLNRVVPTCQLTPSLISFVFRAHGFLEATEKLSGWIKLIEKSSGS